LIKALPLKSSTNHKKGQIIIEYILLIAVSAALALLLVNLVSVAPPDAGSSGSTIFEYWKNLLRAIGQDIST